MIRIDPVIEIYYPDRGGWFGFSICVWKTNYKNYDNILLSYQWGSLSDYPDNLKKAKYVFEARFFVYGVLLKQILKTSHYFKSMRVLSQNIYTKWKPIMDELKAKEKILHQDKTRTRTHIDEFVEDRNSLKESL